MPTMRDIKRRIHSVDNIKQITRAMKMVAGARLRRAQEQLIAMRPYAREIASLAFHVLADSDPIDIPLMSPPNPDAPPTVVLFTSDRGLCGSFNGNLIRAGLRHIEKLSSGGRRISLVPVGYKGRAFFSRRKARKHFENVDILEWPDLNVHSTVGRFTSVASAVETSIAEGASSGLVVIYALFHTVITQEIVTHNLVPLQPDTVRPLMDDKAPHEAWDPEHRPSPLDLSHAVFGRFLATQLYRAFVENWTSEMGARMTAMDAATNNAEDLTSSLTLEYNKARQAAITREIVDITGGAEALRQQ
ncbi:MAG: ATP synthase F1 subunit gamma [Planctomycetes bacterium]|nr:ATP synthase F1 subunit gamma [Planctomycetota bacterium]